MIRYLIKNNVKLMARSKTNILIIVIAPLILIALLSSAFKDMMERYEGSDIVAGYRVEGDVPDELIEAFVDGANENGFTLREFATGNPEDILKDNDIGGFVIFEKDSYKLYQSSDYKEEGKILEYFVNAFYENTAETALSMASGGMAGGAEADSIDLRVEHPDYMKSIDSTDYYGIIEIVYFGWCAIVCGAGIFMSEKKYRIRKKYQVSNLNEFQLYLAKFIPIVVAVFLGIGLAGVLSVVLFGVHYGNILYTLLIILFSVAAASAFGLMVYNIFDNLVVTIIAVFAAVWFAGFFGGSFETYMYSVHPMEVKLASPIYHINRSLVELSCMGHSDYISSACFYSAAIIVVCSIVAVIAGTLRKRGKA